MSKEQDMLPVVVPEALASLPSSGTLEKNKTLNGWAKYDSINLKNSKQLTIKGEVKLYVVGDMILGNSARIVISDDGKSSLELFVGGSLICKNGSELNNETEDPKRFKMYCLDTCTEVDCRNSNKIYGAIYAPHADIVFHNSVEIYGSIVGKSLELKNSAKIFYDPSLRNVGPEDQAVQFIRDRWSED
jgi:hypothetical protein